ncbi:MAG: hypothetical protein R2864_15045 [Syntrophotaleaceae bacterium]
MEAMKAEAAAQNLDVEFVRSGCMTICYAEPTVEVTLPVRIRWCSVISMPRRRRPSSPRYVKEGEVVGEVIEQGFERVVL